MHFHAKNDREADFNNFVAWKYPIFSYFFPSLKPVKETIAPYGTVPVHNLEYAVTACLSL